MSRMYCENSGEVNSRHFKGNRNLLEKFYLNSNVINITVLLIN